MESGKVFVFPCVSRSTDDATQDLSAKLMSEKNITNIIKSITDNKSYVISWTNSVLKCVINGYYFEVEEEKTRTKYARVVMQTTGDIIYGDDGDGFGGLEITESKPTEELAKQYLLICEGGEVPATSKIKFSSQSFDMDDMVISSIDCGELK